MQCQLASTITTPSGPALVLSGSKEIPPGERAALLLADGLFRLDVLIDGDALQAFIRNLSPGELEIDTPGGQLGGTTIALGSAADYSPGRADLRFRLGTGSDRLEVIVTVGTLHLRDRGSVRVSGLALARQRCPGGP